MRIYEGLKNADIAALLRAGAIGVLPTDTMYGIVADAANAHAVARLFTVRQRDAHKSCIVLVGDAAQLRDRQAWTAQHSALMAQYWPGPVSLVLPTTTQTPAYLKRDDGTVAYRVPSPSDLHQLLLRTGPLIAPSANPQGQTPATTMQQAMDYFGDAVDFYVDGGDLSGNQPSVLLRVSPEGELEVLRGQLPQA